MENLVSLRFEKRQLGEHVDYLFKGIRCTEDITYKLSIVLGELLGCDVYLEVEDEESMSSIMFKKEDIVDYDEEDETHICID